MSNTKRYITPGWSEHHVDWSFGSMTEKCQSRDRHNGKSQFSRKHRFTNHIKNSLYNLLKKIDRLRLKESLEEE